MIDGKKSLPQDVINSWPEVFNEVTLNVLPLEYVQTVIIDFKDGKLWEIAITTHALSNIIDFEISLAEMIKTYKDNITEVNVRINTKKVKHDVEKSIKKMLKKIKL